MRIDKSQLRFAVLIDAENAQASMVKMLLSEVSQYGLASVKRAYGDWTTPHLNSWKETLHEHAIQPIQQFRYTAGKNSSDSALIIDAMDILYSARIQGFCLVSSDSDFTRLATRLREAGTFVLGIGEKKTPQAFVCACDKFVYTEILRDDDKRDEEKCEAKSVSLPSRKDSRELRGDSRLVHLLRQAVESCANDDGWAPLSRVGAQLVKRTPDFDSRNYGYSRLRSLVAATELFDLREHPTDSGQTLHVVRDKRVGKPANS